MNVQKGGSPSQINRGAAHIVFVEGGNDDAFDPTVIREFLRTNKMPMDVRAIGACDNVVEAAKAMAWQHPTYYFLADRDGRTAGFVEHSWNNFLNPSTSNLLFWRKRELENYFIAPEYLMRSEWLRAEVDAPQLILAEANRRLFLEAVNLVLLKIRAEVTAPPRASFTQPFTNREDALTALQNSPELQARGKEIAALLEAKTRETMLDEVLAYLSGGKPSLEYGSGEWLNMISGKEIFRAVAGQVFRVRDASGNVLQGRDQNNEVAKGLLREPLAEQPSDFQQLVELLRDKTSPQ